VFDIENPVADVFFDPTPATNPHRILFAGRLIRRKGLHHLLPALQLARRDVPGVELVLAGEMESESDYVASLRAFAAEHSLPVQFLGPLSTPEMVEQYRACAFTVLPSKQETAPVVIEEAMAMGRAVIATRAGGVPAMIEHERTGLLVDYGDVGGLAASMTRLLREPGLAAQMGQQAHEQAVRRFRGDAVARQTYEAYGAVLQAARPAGRRK
jgi:spore coat protein SA